MLPQNHIRPTAAIAERRSQKEAKKFARSKMTEADHIAAGTLNPHLPNTVIAQKGGSDPRGGEAI
jgi:hypothetical protein